MSYAALAIRDTISSGGTLVQSKNSIKFTLSQPTETGLLPPLMLETIIIDQMKATTFLSVSQACAQGLIAVFTTKDCKFFHAKDVIPHLQALSKNAIPVITGKVEDGLYLMDSK